MVREVRVGEAIFGGGRPLVLIAGPCVIETLEHTLRTAEALKGIAARLGVGLVKTDVIGGNQGGPFPHAPRNLMALEGDGSFTHGSPP